MADPGRGRWNPTRRWARWRGLLGPAGIAVSLFFFVLACDSLAVNPSGGTPVTGLQCLLKGRSEPTTELTWYANPALGLGLLCVLARLPKTAAGFGAVGFLLAATTPSVVYSVFPGYYLWQA